MSNPRSDTALSERAQRLLRALIERYIEEGQPVGSRALAREAGLDLSPATVRNVMADLEEMGLITAPHTSAGRVPTVHGYRLFVDALLTIEPLETVEVEKLNAQLEFNEDPKLLLESASRLLSGITHMASVVMLPRREHTSFRHVEFLPLSSHRVLAILVTNEQEVQNRIIHTEREYSAAQLREASNYLDEAFAGKDIDEVRQAILREMQDTREHMNQMMLAAIDMAQQVLDRDPQTKDYVMAGETNLMTFSELSDMKSLRHLFEAFNQKREILHLLDQCLRARGVNIFIGSESGHEVLTDCSVVTSPYTVDNTPVGVLGIIGPTRMHYERVIPIVDVTAKLLGAALNQR